jgi:hypothetical protein
MSVNLTILCFFVVVWLAFGCFYLSEEYGNDARETNELCKRNKKPAKIIFPHSSGCDDNDLNAKAANLDSKSSVFGFAGIGLLLTCFFLPILLVIRENQKNKNEFESIMNSDAAKPD